MQGIVEKASEVCLGVTMRGDFSTLLFKWDNLIGLLGEPSGQHDLGLNRLVSPRDDLTPELTGDAYQTAPTV